MSSRLVFRMCAQVAPSVECLRGKGPPDRVLAKPLLCFWQPIPSGLNQLLLLSCVTVCVLCHCCPAWPTVVCFIPCVSLSGLS